MGLNDWLALLGTLGGFEAIRWGVTFWANRKTDARKEDASADGMEIQNLFNSDILFTDTTFGLFIIFERMRFIRNLFISYSLIDDCF